jgi:hypothetical protein
LWLIKQLFGEKMKKLIVFYMVTIVQCVILILSCTPKSTASQQKQAKFAEFDEFVAFMEETFYVPPENSTVLTKEDLIDIGPTWTIRGNIPPKKTLADGTYIIRITEGEFAGSSKTFVIRPILLEQSWVSIPISNWDLVNNRFSSTEGIFLEEVRTWINNSGYIVFDVSGGEIQTGVYTRPSIKIKSEMIEDLGPIKETTLIPFHNYRLLIQIFNESDELLWQKQYEEMLPVAAFEEN